MEFIKKPLRKLPFYKHYINLKKWLAFRKFDTCSPDTIPALQNAFERTKDLNGNYFEFGLFKGYLFYKAHEFAKNNNAKDISFFGFDSFEGLPQIEEIDSGAKFDQGKYACGLDRVETNLKNKKLDLKNTHLIKGFYDQSLKDPEILRKYDFGKVKVALIDCDLYTSTRDVLNFIGPYLQDGSIILMDDWNCFDADDSKGERLATNEFLAKNQHIKLDHIGDFGWHGAYFKVSMQ